jgi:outer membrane lipoprotein carrier protein
MTMKRIAMLALVVLLAPPAARPGDDAQEVLAKLEKKYSSIRDAVVKFRQDVRFGVTKAEQRFSGTFTMKKGNKYRIELEDQVIVTDGRTVWSFTKSSRQVIVDAYKEDPASFSPDKVLVNVPAQYTSVLLDPDSSGNAVLKLTPKKPRSSLKWMKVWVDKHETLMRVIQVLDASDNLTTYTVEDLKVNTGLDDARFHFDPPAGVDVIDLR